MSGGGEEVHINIEGVAVMFSGPLFRSLDTLVEHVMWWTRVRHVG